MRCHAIAFFAAVLAGRAACGAAGQNAAARFFRMVRADCSCFMRKLVRGHLRESQRRFSVEQKPDVGCAVTGAVLP